MTKDEEIQDIAKALEGSLGILRDFNAKYPVDPEKAWQRRLLAERDSLKIKYDKLDEFLEDCEAWSDEPIDDDTQLLFEQHTIMAAYGNILDRRIARI